MAMRRALCPDRPSRMGGVADQHEAISVPTLDVDLGDAVVARISLTGNDPVDHLHRRVAGIPRRSSTATRGSAPVGSPRVLAAYP